MTCTMGGWSCRLGQRRRPGEAGGVRLRGAHVTEQACRGGRAQDWAGRWEAGGQREINKVLGNAPKEALWSK